MKKGSHDRISSLAAELRSKILTLLPIRDAVRTSVLSSVWKKEYASIPDLEIWGNQFVSADALVRFVDALLLLRAAPIRKFWLYSLHGLEITEAMYRWINVFSRDRIEELQFRISSPTQLTQTYKVPLSLFTCVSLNVLVLSHCTIKLPSNFKGFELLNCLVLLYFSASQTDLERLILSCPRLKKLALRNIVDMFDNLNICALNLQKLDILGRFKKLDLQAPNLAELFVNLRLEANFLSEVTMQQRERNFTAVFGQCFHSIAGLTLNSLAMKLLGFWNLPEKFHGSFDNMKVVDIQIRLPCSIDTAAARCLLQISQSVKWLKIRCCADASLQHSNDAQLQHSDGTRLRTMVNPFKDCSFPHLKVLTMVAFSGLEEELVLLKQVHATSPSLEKVEFLNYKCDHKMNRVYLSRVVRAFTNAQVVFTDSPVVPETPKAWKRSL